ncbi:UDP-N-acetylglucosamine--N-acetylmuramyl-(pentapeptide) pyrophosphoryl-undecaprenol N-acetylglucosamine transferase [Patescibacteria group bacterium]|nr:UDP-N-acetylglucosamine--N-acetylmuramyl-(pentapeptide) pyrophosphoryl-undecaprenol N-acetylglucosamine transferase [Patescibacteria group bacterium]
MVSWEHSFKPTDRQNYSEHNMYHEHKHILMTGGGTLGPVTPLLALAEVWKEQDSSVVFSWIGTEHGPESDLIEEKDISFYSLSAPKLDRYKKLSWLLVVPQLVMSCVRAFALLKNIQPHMVFTAGGYVSVPIVIVAWMMRIPCWVHQLDVTPGIANRVMAPFAKRISVTWEESAESFSKRKTEVVGGLIRPYLLDGDSELFKDIFELDTNKPTVAVFGGGTGATAINETLEAIISDLQQRMNVIHLAGKGKLDEKLVESKGTYVAREFFTNMADLYAAADLVVARAGMGTILEVAALRKPTILIPIPNSHQEANAKLLGDREAAIVIDQLNPQVLKQEIEKMMFQSDLRQRMIKNLRSLLPMHGAGKIINAANAILKR